MDVIIDGWYQIRNYAFIEGTAGKEDMERLADCEAVQVIGVVRDFVVLKFPDLMPFVVNEYCFRQYFYPALILFPLFVEDNILGAEVIEDAHSGI